MAVLYASFCYAIFKQYKRAPDKVAYVYVIDAYLQLPIRREKEVKELKEKMKKIAPNDPSMEGLKKSLAELEVKREDAASKVGLAKCHFG